MSEEKVDFTKLKPYIGKPKMQDPMRYPKVQGPIEQEAKDKYEVELNRMLIDITKYLTQSIRKPK